MAPIRLCADATDRFGFGGAGGWGDVSGRGVDRDQTSGGLFGSGWIRIGLSERNEFLVSYDSIQLTAEEHPESGRNRIRPVTVGLWHSLFPNKRWTPVATIGVGRADLRWMDGTETKTRTALAAQGGLGLEYFLASGFSAGVLTRLHYVYNSSDRPAVETTAYTLGIMANVFWGGEELPKPPAPQPRALPSAYTDADRDGVADVADLCPETAPGTGVDSDGCPDDSDGDGVRDLGDACPDTPAGTRVDGDGCPARPGPIPLDIKFEVGETTPRSAYDPQLRAVSEYLKLHPDDIVVLEGHTDSAGSSAGNEVLSRKRAEAVRRILVKRFGVDADRVMTQGAGAGRPVLVNSSPEGRAANRRVTATFVPGKKRGLPQGNLRRNEPFHNPPKSSDKTPLPSDVLPRTGEK